MTTDTVQLAAMPQGNDPVLQISTPESRADMFTILGIAIAAGLIACAVTYSQSHASFIDLPSLAVVIIGTAAVTCISYTAREIRNVASILGTTLIRQVRKPSIVASQLMDLATICRKRGALIIPSLNAELRHDILIYRAMQLVAEGYSGDDIDRMLGQENDALAERHRRSASILRRASEIAPAIGLIGTLIALVQMLSALGGTEPIGPSVALALLTTFYGVILGMVILAPLAGKLERNSQDEAMIRVLVMNAAISIARQENPKRLEITLNNDLPPDERIRYF